MIIDSRVAFAVEQFLPLTYHSEIHIVDDKDLEREFHRNRWDQLLDCHDIRPITVDIDDGFVWASKLRADSSRETKAHSAEATRIEPLPRFGEFEVLCRPHLVLPNIGNNNRIAVMFINFFNDVLRHHLITLLLVFKWIFLLPFLNLSTPWIDIRRTHQLIQFSENALGITDDRNIYGYIFPNTRRINIDMDFLGVGREFTEIPGNAVVKPCADSDNKVSIGEGIICTTGTVHAGHLHRQWMRFRECAKSHQGNSDRNLCIKGELPQFLTGIGKYNTTASIKHRTLGFLNQCCGFRDLRWIAMYLWLVAADVNRLWVVKQRLMYLCIFGDVNDNWSRLSGLGDVKRLSDNVRDLVVTFDEVTVFTDWSGYPNNIAFLEGIAADIVGENLSSNCNHRN